MNKHSNIYEVLLGLYALTVFYTCGWVLLAPSGPLNQKIIALAICLSLGLMTVVVLTLRIRKSKFACLATRIINFIYLPLFPLGTPLGIYGLLMVDRKAEQRNTNEGNG